MGEFYSVNNSIEYQSHIPIDWPGLYKPVDEPHCGYDGSKCPRAKGNTEIAAGILGGEVLKHPRLVAKPD